MKTFINICETCLLDYRIHSNDNNFVAFTSFYPLASFIVDQKTGKEQDVYEAISSLLVDDYIAIIFELCLSNDDLYTTSSTRATATIIGKNNNIFIHDLEDVYTKASEIGVFYKI